MPVNRDYVEQLVLEKLAGIITPADNTILSKLLEEEPEALKIWQEINAELTDSYLTAIREDLDNTLSVDEILASAEEEERQAQKNKKWRWVPMGVVAAALLGYLLLKPYFNTSKVLDNQPLLSNHVTLSMEGQIHALSEFNIQTVKKETSYTTINNVVEGPKNLLHQIPTENGMSLIDRNGLLTCPKTGSSQQATVKVPAKKRYKMVLSDGTKVMLNATTEISFPVAFNGNTREIYIKGEAFLDVAPNPNKPFIVHMTNSDVKVLGTAFNVNTYDPENVHVALVKGKVSMYSKSDSVTLTPGKAGTCQHGKQLTTAPFKAEEVLAWQNRIYNFSKEPLSEVMNIINREYGIIITYDDPGVKDNKVMAWLDVSDTNVGEFMANLKIAQICDYQFKGTGKDSVLHIAYYKK